MNLIRDPWIPCRLRSGTRSYLRPAEISPHGDDPAIALASPRADFDGSLAQLLIGLLQCALPPRSAGSWLGLAADPPTVAALDRAFEPFAAAFELYGAGPRVLQDRRLADGPFDWPIEKLLMEQGLGEGSDHFCRSGSVPAMCLRCVAAALVNLQTSAPAGGRGHLTSLRGGGPLTTLVIPQATNQPLWTTLWLNVLPLESLGCHAPDPRRLDRLFPWLTPPGQSEPAAPLELTTLDAHPLQVYFGMPRRFLLAESTGGECGLCGAGDEEVVRDYATRGNGIRYSGTWRHPLSPYRQTKDGLDLALKGPQDGIGYRQWLGLVVSPPDGSVVPAGVVREAAGDQERLDQAGDLRVWAFGYVMDNIKTKAWSEGVMPLWEIPEQLRPAFGNSVGSLIEAARLVDWGCRSAFKKLVSNRPGDVKEPHEVSARFWELTEVDFYRAAHASLGLLAAGQPADEAHREWLHLLGATARRFFEEWLDGADFRAIEPGRAARAWSELQRFLNGPKLLTALDLPKPQSKAKASKTKKGEPA